MNNAPTQPTQHPDQSSTPASQSGPPGTEAALKGGKQPAKQQAERDSENSAKEDGE